MTNKKQPGYTGVHPTADMFPLLDDEELAVLAADIKRHGLKMPIVLDADGRILDGRNRARACELAGVTPTFTTYDGEAPDMYVLSANAYRRHMTPGARAMVIGVVLAAAGKRRNGRWVRGSVPTAITGSGNSGSQRMTEVGILIDQGDEDIIKRVVLGDLALAAAVELVKPTSLEEHEAAIDKGLSEAASFVDQAVAGGAAPDAVLDHLEANAVADLGDDMAQVVRSAVDSRRRRDAPAAPAPAASRRRREVLNPEQRKERREKHQAVVEEAMAPIRDIATLLDRVDSVLHDIDIAQLPGEARNELTKDLERHTGTITWALDVLRRGNTG